MIHRLLSLSLLTGALAMAGAVWSYDSSLAEGYAKLLTPVKGADASKALHVIPPEGFVNGVKAGEPMVALDVRTPVEMSIFTAVLPGSLAIPIDELFTPTNLDRLPVDQKIVVLCATGARAMVAVTGLRHVGFENVYILKGGFKGLADYLNPKTANEALTPKKP
jgi:rhodanese-related sulfurtransferase